jgi:dipeptidyl aminopeptidase/acylaminoacyl peptidase
MITPHRAGALQLDHYLPRDTFRISLAENSGPSRHSVTLDDILSVREVSETSLSPDGQWVAFFVREAFRDCNCYRTALYVTPHHGAAWPVKLVEGSAFGNLRWAQDSRFLTYLSTASGSRQLWRVSRDAGSPEQVFAHMPGQGQGHFDLLFSPRDSSRIGVERFELSPDGRQVAFTTRAPTDTMLARRIDEAGVVYDQDAMWVFDILRKTWMRQPAELWVYDLQSRAERRVWRAPDAGAMSWAESILNLAWAPDGKRIAISYASGPSSITAWVNYDIGVLDLSTHHFEPIVVTDSTREDRPAWSPDGERIAFYSSGDLSLPAAGAATAVGLVNVKTHDLRYFGRDKTGLSVTGIWWSLKGQAIVLEVASPEGAHREMNGLFQVDLPSGTPRRLTAAGQHISQCGGLAHEKLACVRQNPNTPNDPIIVDLRKGRFRGVATVNLQLKSVTLSPVREIRWRNRFGTESNGYLLQPAGYVPGRKYPLIVILYYFEGRFVAAAEWITSYPAQALARDGFAVLLWNYPRSEPWRGNDFARALVADGYSPLSSLESAVRMLIDQGLADSSRVGIMGWSHGGFWTELALTHSPLFRAASVGNDGDYNPGAYWFFGHRAHRAIYERYFEGPPAGQTFANWAALSPALNANRVRVPVLLEASADESILTLEMAGALQRESVPVEFVIYPDEGHVLMQPLHRLSSMQRNLDWFGFWLLGKESPDSAKHDQYTRWRGMRDQVARLRASDAVQQAAHFEPEATQEAGRVRP